MHTGTTDCDFAKILFSKRRKTARTARSVLFGFIFGWKFKYQTRGHATERPAKRLVFGRRFHTQSTDGDLTKTFFRRRRESARTARSVLFGFISGWININRTDTRPNAPQKDLSLSVVSTPSRPIAILGKHYFQNGERSRPQIFERCQRPTCVGAVSVETRFNAYSAGPGRGWKCCTQH